MDSRVKRFIWTGSNCNKFDDGCKSFNLRIKSLTTLFENLAYNWILIPLWQRMDLHGRSSWLFLPDYGGEAIRKRNIFGGPCIFVGSTVAFATLGLWHLQSKRRKCVARPPRHNLKIKGFAALIPWYLHSIDESRWKNWIERFFWDRGIIPGEPMHFRRNMVSTKYQRNLTHFPYT